MEEPRERARRDHTQLDSRSHRALGPVRLEQIQLAKASPPPELTEESAGRNYEREGRDSTSAAQPLQHVADYHGHQEARTEHQPRGGIIKETVSTNF